MVLEERLLLAVHQTLPHRDPRDHYLRNLEGKSKIVGLFFKPIAFVTFSLPWPSSDLKVPTSYFADCQGLPVFYPSWLPANDALRCCVSELVWRYFFDCRNGKGHQIKPRSPEHSATSRA